MYQSVLGDLLNHLGLSQSDTQNLLTRATDNHGRTSPTSLLALFNVAALRQDQVGGLGQGLKDLAGVLQAAKTTTGTSSDADHLRARATLTLQKIEVQISTQTQSLSQHWQQAPSEAQEALKISGASGQATAQAASHSGG